MGEQVAVGKVPAAAGVVRHGVHETWNVAVPQHITMCALVESLKVEEEGACREGGGGAPGSPSHRGVIAAGNPHGTLSNIARRRGRPFCAITQPI